MLGRLMAKYEAWLDVSPTRTFILTAVLLFAALITVRNLWEYPGLIPWGIICLCQNITFTGVSRSRNGGDKRWHRMWSYGSNGTWLLNILVGLDKLLDFKHAHNWGMVAFCAIFYSVICTEGSVRAQSWLIKKETAKQRPGGV